MCKHVGCVGCPMGVPGIQSSHGVAGSTCEANVWAWQHTHQSCRQQCTAVQQQLLASVMRRWMRMTTASHQSTSLRSSIAGSARDRSAMWSAAVAFVASTHHVLELVGETERETAKRHFVRNAGYSCVREDCPTLAGDFMATHGARGRLRACPRRTHHTREHRRLHAPKHR